MKKLLIISGKGGTGKTTIASSFIGFSDCKSYGDCDVDAPNLHLTRALGKGASFEEKPFVGSKKAKIDQDKCLSCGKCQSLCRFGAVEALPSGKYQINELFCEGCEVCFNFSSCDAISLYDDVSGKSTVYQDEERIFSDAELKMGRGNSGKLVSFVKARLGEKIRERDGKNNRDGELMIIDGAPGIGCVVIASLSAMDMALVVAEPSLSGLHDLKRIVKTASSFGVKIAVCVNKADLSKEKTAEIESFCQEEGLFFVGAIPYDKSVSKAVNSGKSMDKIPSKARDAIFSVYEKVVEILFSEETN